MAGRSQARVRSRRIPWLRRNGLGMPLRATDVRVDELAATRNELVREAERMARREAAQRGWDVGIMLHAQLPTEIQLENRVLQKAAAVTVNADQLEVYAKALVAAADRVETALTRRGRAVERRDELARSRAAVVAQIRGGPR